MQNAETRAETPSPAVPPRPSTRLTWRETRALMRSDFQRMPEIASGTASFSQRVFAFVQPNHLGVYLYRVARYMHLRQWYAASTALALFSSYVTRIEIPPATVIGAGCRIVHAPTILCGHIGERFTCYGFGGCGGGHGSKDIGAGVGFPVIGNDVVMSITSTVLGAVHIGDGARLGPGSTVTTDVPAGALVVGALSRIARDKGAAATQASNHSTGDTP